MERRKVFMELLAVKGREDNLYDLLLNLKAGRQDADILIATI
jgi:redox-sensitive bicupin YhaK (pirin superfamily)